MSKKTCSLCGKPKALTEFNKKGKGRTARCKTCLGEGYKKAYKENPARRQQVIGAIQRRRKKLIAFTSSLKTGKECADCHKPYPHFVLDFHHEGDKEVCLSKAAHRGWSEERILKEASKCVLLCANCHRFRTWGHSSSSRAPAR